MPEKGDRAGGRDNGREEMMPETASHDYSYAIPGTMVKVLFAAREYLPRRNRKNG